MYLDTIKEFMSKVNLTDSGLTDSVGTVKHPIDKYTIEYYDNDYTITAFKSYITIKKPHQNYVGTLEEMIVKYNEDKKYIETLLIVAYQNNNKLLGLDEAVYSTLADKLNIIQSYINCIKVKKESEYQLNHLDNYVKETIEILKNYGLSQFNSSTL
jgi:hypothetical protein